MITAVTYVGRVDAAEVVAGSHTVATRTAFPAVVEELRGVGFVGYW